ncbi:uncharacterized protein LOC129573171 [Sitodiplosis mosellana]|uniref:uncharacterized protein LOC129573171 n=1 Tax=Sitodiplosis mosellana TaxID=263140 RepID=UPI0024438EFE|nr:uncharacterized protein LOC129573171 [Sitodiplosis mosellana]
MGNSLLKLSRRNSSNESDGNKNRTWTQWNGRNANETPIPVDSFDENEHFLSSPILKLIGHCFDDLLEYLSLTDLHSLGQTCKSMQQITGEFFKRNYSAAHVVCLSDGFYVIFHKDAATDWMTNCISIPGFMQFITSIDIGNHVVNKKKSRGRGFHNPSFYKDLDIKLKYIKLHAEEMKTVKKLTLTNVRVDNKFTNCILDILPNIEKLKLLSSTVIGDFYDIFLKYCTNVKHLQICGVIFENNSKWLLRQYATIEHLDWVVSSREKNLKKVDELIRFFELNRNVRTFSCDMFTISSNVDAFLNSNIKLDTFELKQFRISQMKGCDIYSLNEQLCHLHSHGFFKRLHISTVSIDLGFLKPFVEQIFTLDREHLAWSSHMAIGCKEFGMLCSLRGVGYNKIFANSLERPGLNNRKEILEYFEQMKNLTKIKLINFEFEAILNLEMLNMVREQLDGAQKVTIYVPDAVYLATKRATTNGTTNFSRIAMKRHDSYEWKLQEHLLTYFKYMEYLNLRRKGNKFHRF